MNPFEKEFGGYRNVEVQIGDTLQRISLRELGNADRWVEIAELNNLHPPYLSDVPTGDPQIAAAGTAIMVPSPVQSISATTNPDQVFDNDLLLSESGSLMVNANGDWDLAVGINNVTQALKNRLQVDKTELMFHPEFGCWIRRLIGKGNSKTVGRLGGFYTKSALEEDDRVDHVISCEASITGDVIQVVAVVMLISGRQVNLSLEF